MSFLVQRSRIVPHGVLLNAQAGSLLLAMEPAGDDPEGPQGSGGGSGPAPLHAGGLATLLFTSALHTASFLLPSLSLCAPLCRVRAVCCVALEPVQMHTAWACPPASSERCPLPSRAPAGALQSRWTTAATRSARARCRPLWRAWRSLPARSRRVSVHALHVVHAVCAAHAALERLTSGEGGLAENGMQGAC